MDNNQTNWRIRKIRETTGLSRYNWGEKFLRVFLVILLLAQTFAGIFLFPIPEIKEARADGESWETGYTYRKKIVIDHNKVSGLSNLSHFPVLISVTDPNLATTANGGHVTDDEGDDIVFTSSDGATDLDHEVEKYTLTTGELKAWVRIPTLDYNDNTVIYIYYGNSSVTTSQEQITGVWNENGANDYKMVQHLDETGANPQVVDSTQNDNDSTSNDADPTTSGQIDGAMDFTASSSDYITISDTDNSLDLGSNFSISFWAYKTGSFKNWDSIISGDDYHYAIYFDSGAHILIYEDISFAASTGTVSADAWHYITWVHSDKEYYYINGELDSFDTLLAASPAAISNLYIGDDSAASGYFDGKLDEVRISNTDRSADWIATEYNNQKGPGFYLVGYEETSGNSTPYSCGWTNRKKITIDHNKVPNTDQADFPVLINTTNTDFSAAQTDGDDILFTSSDGTTKLNHELEKWDDATGELVAHVRVLTLSSSSDTELYIYYGNSSAVNQENPEGVWDSDYKMVQHLEETSGNAIDSTSNDNDGTPNAGVTLDAAGKIDGADEINGTDGNIDVKDSVLVGNDANLTIEAWVKADTLSGSDVIYSENTTGEVFSLYTTSGVPNFFIRVGVTDYMTNNTDTISIDTYYHLVGVLSSSAGMKLYINGIEKGTNGNTNPGNHTIVKVLIGDITNAGTWSWDGIIDEFRVSSTPRSADWIATSHNNQRYPDKAVHGSDGFYTVMSIPTVTVQAATDVQATTATANGNITVTNPNSTKRGFVYGTTSQSDPGSAAPTASGYDSYAEDTGDFGTGAFTKALSSLIPETTYYIRAYAYNVVGYNYSDTELDFTTPASNTAPTNDSLDLLSHNDGEEIFASQTYTWQAQVTDADGYEDLTTVVLHLDPDGDDQTITWTQASDSFSESSDYFADASSSSSCAGNTCTLDFKLTMDWDWAAVDDTATDARVVTTDDQSASDTDDYTSDTFQVENDLDFSGTLACSGSVQGALSSNDWVQGSETLSWSGLTVVYQGSAINPANADFNVRITDDDTGTWTQTTGANLILSTTADTATDPSDIHVIDIINIPAGGSDVSNKAWIVKVDADISTNVGANTPADEATEVSTDTALIALTAADANSGLSANPYYLELATNSDFTENVQNSGWDADGTWNPALSSNSTYYWRVKAKDAVGNESSLCGHIPDSTGYGTFITLQPQISLTKSVKIEAQASVLGAAISSFFTFPTWFLALALVILVIIFVKKKRNPCSNGRFLNIIFVLGLALILSQSLLFIRLTQAFEDEGEEVNPSDILTYKIVYQNISETEAEDAVIIDSIPNGTSYVTSSLNINGASKTDALDSDEADFNQSNSKAATFNLGTIAKDASGYVTFQIKVNDPKEQETIANQGQANFNPGEYTVFSNTVSNLVEEEEEEEVPEDEEEDEEDEEVPKDEEDKETPKEEEKVIPPEEEEEVEVPEEEIPEEKPVPKIPGITKPIPTKKAEPKEEVSEPEVPKVEVTEAKLKTVSERLSQGTVDVITTVLPKQAAEFYEKNIIQNKAVQTGIQAAATPLVTAATAGITAISITTTSIAFGPYLIYLWQFLLSPLAMLSRKERKAWGVVYNSLTKQPVDLAMVRLWDSKTKKLLQTKVTGRDGRYMFMAEAEKEYYLTVTKPDYEFPCRILEKAAKDPVYQDLYYGEPIAIKLELTSIQREEGKIILPQEVVNLNIPLGPKSSTVFASGLTYGSKTKINSISDLLALSGEERTKENQSLIASYKKVRQRRAISSLGPVLGLVCFILSPSLYTVLLLPVQLLACFFFRRLTLSYEPKAWGKVKEEKTKQGLPLVVIRLFDKRYGRLLLTQVTPARGRYGFLVGKENYILTCEKEGYQAPLKLEILGTKEGIVRKDVEMKKK